MSALDAPEPVETVNPEPAFAARIPPPEPVRPLPTRRRVIFFDVENNSRVTHVSSILAHLAIDRGACRTDLVAVGNWRVIGHDTARLFATRGAQLVHSAPSTGVKDWSDLRIAVASGVWLAGARHGDLIEIISDDQAFDAVGDVAASLGVEFHRLSYRALAGAGIELPVEESTSTAAPRRRSRRGGRGRRRGPALSASRPVSRQMDTQPAPNEARPPAIEAEISAVLEGGNGGALEPESAPADEIVGVVQDLISASASGTVTIDALSNALKARGFRRPPGSLRLITRLRRIKELDVSRPEAIRLVEAGSGGGGEVGESGTSELQNADTPAAPRRRRRRGGRGRRRRHGPATEPSSAS